MLVEALVVVGSVETVAEAKAVEAVEVALVAAILVLTSRVVRGLVMRAGLVAGLTEVEGVEPVAAVRWAAVMEAMSAVVARVELEVPRVRASKELVMAAEVMEMVVQA